MGLVKPDINTFAKIKVLGVGGGGGNALNSMVSSNIKGVEFIAVNTDAQALLTNQAETKLQIGQALTKGLGSGADAEVGRQAALESQEEIKEFLFDSDMVFVTAGMGGGTGSGASSVVAQLAKEVGALTVAVVTKPFAFEGTRRMRTAEESIEELREHVDTLIIIPNQRLLDVVDKKMSLLEAFKVADSVLTQGVQGISDLITTPGLINVDFADVRTIMTDAGSALMGIGHGVGENRATTAARMAISSPLLEVSIDGARGILFNIIGGPDMTMNEINEASSIISQAADPDANIIFGATIDEKMADQIKISVIGTGFDSDKMGFSGSDFGYNPPAFTSSKPAANQPDPNISQPHPVPSDNPSSSTPVVAPQVEETKETTTDKPEEPPEMPSNEFEDEFDIPAFLRQNKS